MPGHTVGVDNKRVFNRLYTQGAHGREGQPLTRCQYESFISVAKAGGLVSIDGTVVAASAIHSIKIQLHF